MAGTNSLSDYLAELGVDINNMQEFLNKLSLMFSTNSDSVTVTQTMQDGSTKTFVVPSMAYITNKVNSLDTKFNSVLTANASQIGVVDENGQVRTFELKDTSQVVSDLDTVSSKSITTPAEFNYKSNWFFESFLNPLLYVNVPVDAIATSDIDRFEAIRVLITSTTQTDLDYFDGTYKGKNDIDYATLINDLNARKITYFEDSNETVIPPFQNKVSGSFDLLSMLSDVEAKVVMGETQTLNTTKYVLNTLRYMEKAPTSPTGVVYRVLKPGDSLLTKDGSEYKVTAVDTNQTSVTLQRVFGLGELVVGAGTLMIKPQLDVIKQAPVNVGFDERQVIFMRPISSRLQVTTPNISLGFGIYSNELTITMPTGEVLTLADFYNQFVSDFSLVFLNYTKEKKIPPILGEKPNAVVLSADSFKVVQVDSHIQTANDIQTVKQNVASVETIKSQINEVDKQMSDKKQQLNTNAALTPQQQLKLNQDLKTLTNQRATLSTAHASKISSITTAVKGTPILTKPPTYRVKGMWPIPEPITTTKGVQQAAQFKISYRVLSTTGTSETAEQITFTDPKGNKISGSFSPWKEILGKPRTKTFNSTTGFYEWAPENIADPNTVNSNQVELPINKGEVLEIRVKTLSEAGWPDNPVESDWSNSILVEFPASMQTIEDISVIAQQAFAEEAKINFQNDLNSKGLDVHLATAFTSKDKYFTHKSDDIASGFFDTTGGVIDLYTKLKTMNDTLTAIQTSIATGAGQIVVSIVDQNGNSINVTNGQTIQMFAGYYKDQIKKTSGNTTTYDHGKVITNQYYVQISNTSQSPLELIAFLNGGTGEIAPASNPLLTSGYDTNLRYDICPITIANATAGLPGGFKQQDAYQSSQAKGQIINRRVKSMNLAELLVEGDRKTTGTTYDPSFDTNYNYQGVLLPGSLTTVPYSAGHYLPYDPTLSSLTIKVNNVDYSCSPNAAVWDGAIVSTAPEGGGLLSEFCLSVDHPDLKVGGKYNQVWSQIRRPQILSTQQSVLPFSQAIHVETAEADVTNPFGAKYFVQAAYKLPNVNGITSPQEFNYPVKQGFSANDQYLIGKYTCGAYLYLNPASYESIAATSYSPSASKRTVEVGDANALKIPLIFQYRCSDYLKYVGGFRVNQTAGLRNVKYTKQIGFDIQMKNDVFSFDVIVSAQYEKETAVVTPASNINKSNTMSQITLTVD